MCIQRNGIMNAQEKPQGNSNESKPQQTNITFSIILLESPSQCFASMGPNTPTALEFLVDTVLTNLSLFLAPKRAANCRSSAKLGRPILVMKAMKSPNRSAEKCRSSEKTDRPLLIKFHKFIQHSCQMSVCILYPSSSSSSYRHNM